MRTVVLFAVAIVLTASAVSVSGEFTRVFLFTFGSAFGILGLVELAATRYMRSRLITTASKFGQLTMAPPSVLMSVLNIGAAISLLTMLQIQFDPSVMASLDWYDRRVASGVPLLGAFFLAYELWNQFKPAGLTLTESGLHGVRYGPRIRMEWDQLRAVDVADTKRGKTLCLVTAERLVGIPHRSVGGDLHAVATVVDYYRQHPDERHRLNDGVAAVKHVDAEYRAGRYRRV